MRCTIFFPVYDHSCFPLTIACLRFALIRHNHRIRRIEVATGVVTTVAGTGVNAYGDDIGTRAAFHYPAGIRLSPDNAFAFVADIINYCVRRISMATFAVSTLAGSRQIASIDGIGLTASFQYPLALAIAPDSSYLLVADNTATRRISTQAVCAAGSVCPAGSSAPTPCEAGTYCNATGMTAQAAGAVCPAGFFCPLASVQPTACAASTFCNATGASAASDQTACDAGFFCSAASTAQSPCAAGYVCAVMSFNRYGAVDRVGACPMGMR